MAVATHEFTLQVTTDFCRLLPGPPALYGLAADTLHEYVTCFSVTTVWTVGCEWSAKQVRSFLDQHVEICH